MGFYRPRDRLNPCEFRPRVSGDFRGLEIYEPTRVYGDLRGNSIFESGTEETLILPPGSVFKDKNILVPKVYTDFRGN
jgi:hypothetical protein